MTVQKSHFCHLMILLIPSWFFSKVSNTRYSKLSPFLPVPIHSFLAEYLTPTPLLRRPKTPGSLYSCLFTWKWKHLLWSLLYYYYYYCLLPKSSRTSTFLYFNNLFISPFIQTSTIHRLSLPREENNSCWLLFENQCHFSHSICHQLSRSYNNILPQFNSP